MPHLLMQKEPGLINMLKNIIIYRYSDKERNNWKVDEDRIKSSNFENCLINDKGYYQKRIENLISKTENESISLDFSGNEYHRFTVSCLYKSGSIQASDETPFIPVLFEMILRNESSFILCFDSGKNLSKVGTTLLANATTGNPSAIEHILLNKQNFTDLQNWVLSGSLPGQIKRMTMHNVEYGYFRYKQIVLRSENLQNSELFKSLYPSTPIVTNMSFSTPLLRASGRSISGRINYWGGLTIYSGGLLESELFELIRVLERILQ